MTQQENEQKIAYYLFKKSAHVQTEEVARGVGLTTDEVGSFLGCSRYFTFTSGTPVVKLSLTKEGIDFVESKNKRCVDSLIKWGTFVAAIISMIGVVVQFFSKK
ncbi:MAG: hypothetical protein WC694_03685 [Candidatus Paceibacterota bacterium]|jgi:hypothetical protein